MKSIYRHLVIQLFIICLAAMGIAQAKVDFCVSGCVECGALQAVHPCCGDDRYDKFADHHAGSGMPKIPAQCSDGEFCPGAPEPEEAVAGPAAPALDFSGAKSRFLGRALLYPEAGDGDLCPGEPPLKTPPSIYTHNCSFLI